MGKTTTYKDAGVSIAANARWVTQIQSVMRSTHSTRVCSREGAFAGLFRLDFRERPLRRDYKDPVLVGCADGVGTKVLLGIQAKQLRGLGIDLVAMNVNDCLTCGAEPLFFLDYLAVHRLDPDELAEIVAGIADGCRQAGCALLGGETAEMPDLYQRGHLDLAGFSTGVVESNRIIDGHRVTAGDILIGLPSDGIHSNGFTLVRKLIREHRLRLDRCYTELDGEPQPSDIRDATVRKRKGSSKQPGGHTLADMLLKPTRIYVASVLSVLDRYRVKQPVTAMAHITGGGLPENVARILPAGCAAEIDTCSWDTPAVFPFLERLGVGRSEMFNVFNMGIGFVLAVKPTFVAGVTRQLEAADESPIIIGRVKRGRRVVKLK